MFWPVTRSSNQTGFLENMGKMRECSENAHKYLMDIPLQQWTVHEFDTKTKTDHNTNNIVEAFNGWINKYQTLPILTMLESIRRKLRSIGSSSKQHALSTPAQTRQSNNIEVGNNSTHHAHIPHNNSQTRQPNTGTVNITLSQRHACHDNIGSQPFTLNAPRSSQRFEVARGTSSGRGGGENGGELRRESNLDYIANPSQRLMKISVQQATERMSVGEESKMGESLLHDVKNLRRNLGKNRRQNLAISNSCSSPTWERISVASEGG
ncbi:hypothetical protein Dsin_030159 [Dipteronia sinensis]|uniref:Uncharacterized protein n=1 Tax=Dipteronia sinensis TaxID=43782 RepID=A0AAD9ZIE5_9ROSI|nr:hypothetical protein Dsin_030159 [Dipteronia sinensis]